MGDALPAHLVRYLPKGHRLWFAPKADPEAGKPADKRNPNATGGTNRRDWLLCTCGGGLRLEAGPNGESVTPTDVEWLEAVNQCRLAVHSPKFPCPPVTMDGTEQVVREAPPSPVVVVEPAKGRKKLVEA